VLPLVLLSSPAFAYPIPTSQEEYDRYIQEATQKVSEAQVALNIGRQTLLDAVLEVARTQESVNSARQVLEQAETSRSQAQSTYDIAQAELTEAQSNYENNLIQDPSQNGVTQSLGLRVDIYNQINSAGTAIPPRSTNYNLCKTVTFTHINHNWGGGDIEGCGSDFVMFHYTGYLTVPETTPYGYDFLNIADDGWYMELDGVVVNDNWTLKGCSGWWSQKQMLEAGRSYAINAWYYEWGGGACSTLYYDNGYNWGPVPAAWFSQGPAIRYVHDPALEVIVNEKQQQLDIAQEALTVANTFHVSASTTYDKELGDSITAEERQAEAEALIPELENNLKTAITDLKSIQPYISYEQPKPEQTPSPTQEPEPTPEPTVEPVPPTTEEVLDELWAEATQDDIVISEEIATIPVLGSAIVALADAINFVSNVGADMTPEVREQSEKVVVSAIIVTQVATQAVATATLAASSSASAGGSTSSAGRRKE
jgi:hypothetical protein